ncbi:SNF2_family helicase [Hexamita inflata]|uniref:Chromatin-remodeling ATPase INO80 n=1 Tax=Hexamita inflata TaxID=28002 RepID=A0AA86U6H6_9EUKA|nr:SNF2 family helicase [Hexamita inflata]
MKQIQFYYDNIARDGLILNQNQQQIQKQQQFMYNLQLPKCQAQTDSQELINSYDKLEDIDQYINDQTQYILDLQYAQCDELHHPVLPKLQNPLSIKYPNNNVLNSVTLSFFELINDERILIDNIPQTFNQDDLFYKQCVEEAEQQFSNNLHEFLPLEQIQSQEQSIQINYQEGITVILDQIQTHLLPQLQPTLQQKLQLAIQLLLQQKIESARIQSVNHYISLITKQSKIIINQCETEKLIIEGDQSIYKIISPICYSGNNLESLCDLLHIQFEKLQWIPTYNVERQQILTDHLSVFPEDFLCQDQFLQQNSNNESLYIKELLQLILLSLISYYYDSNYINHANKQVIYPDIIDQQFNPHLTKFFEFTPLPFCYQKYSQVLQPNFYQQLSEIPAVMSPLLPDRYDYLISNAGNIYSFNQITEQYEPEQKSQVNYHQKMKQKQQEIQFSEEIKIQEQPVEIIQQFTTFSTLTPPDSSLIKVDFIPTQQLPIPDYFMPNQQPSANLENIRNKCKNQLRMMQTSKKNLIRRFRVNKNANQINSECTRAKKIILDFDQLKKKLMNEGRVLRPKRMWGQGPRKLRQEAPQSQESVARINQRLDETEQMIKEICQDFSDKQQQCETLNNNSDLQIQIFDTPQSFNGVLKHYQKIGFSWLVNMFKQKLNPLLCDQMGLGKTIQIIAFFLYLAENFQYGPFLVICPNSLLNNWISEMKRFADVLNVWPYWGNIQQRQIIRQGLQHLIHINQNNINEVNLNENEIFGTKQCPMHVMVTSYSLAVQDIKYLNKIPWISIVLDEGQMIKSSETKRWYTLMQYQTQNKVLLSGTPVQNSLDELWSLLHFVMPTVFQSKENFADWFGRDIESAATSGLRLNQEQMKRLTNILTPFVLRREKKDVAQQLGEKIEKELKCKMTTRQSKIYKTIKQSANLGELIQTGKDEELNNIIMQLRKVVNHPQIFVRNMMHIPFVLKQESLRPKFLVEDDDELESIMTKLTSTVTTVNQEPPIKELNQMITLSLDGMIHEGTVSNSIQQYTSTKQKPTMKLLSDIISTMTSLYIETKDVQMRENYLTVHIRNDQGLFEYQLPSLFYQFIEQQESLKKFDVLSSLHSLFSIYSISEDMYRCTLAICLALKQNNNPLNFQVCGTGIYNIHFQDQIQYAKLFAEQCHSQKLEQYAEHHCRKNGQCDLVNVHLTKMLIQQLNFVQLPLILNSCKIVKEKTIGFPPILYTQLGRKHQIYIPPIMQPNFSLMQYSGLDQLLEESGKLQMLDRLLFSLCQQKQVSLIYCQMTKMMDILEDYLAFKKYKFVRLDGQMSVAERKSVVDRFMTDPSIVVFLLSTRAGSLGLNLTRASNVIFYESDWNPTSDAQASDRVHRIGQTKNVQIWKIVCQNSIDERIIRRAEEKNRMQKLVLSGQQRDQYGNLLSKKAQTRDLLLEVLGED